MSRFRCRTYPFLIVASSFDEGRCCPLIVSRKTTFSFHQASKKKKHNEKKEQFEGRKLGKKGGRQ